MKDRPISRRSVLKLAGSLLLAGAAGAGNGQRRSESDHLRIGTVFPARSGENPVRASINDFTGQGARMGAILADERVGDAASQMGIRLDVLLASSPSADAARRAAARLVATEEVHVLVGGVGAGQADEIAAVTAAAGIPFLNVGSARDGLRTEWCGESVFHIEPSGAMYLDAMVAFHASRHARNWYIVHEDDASGAALEQRARSAIARHDPSGAVAGSSAVRPGQPVYVVELNTIETSGADTVLLLIEARDQIAFLGQGADIGIDIPTVTFPEAVSQTRDYMAAARLNAAEASPRYRFAAWDVSLDTPDAEALNDRFTSRWGEVMNPTAWASYVAIDLVFQAVQRVGGDPTAIAAALAEPGATFDVRKGVPVSFRSWDHQLRQPIYVVEVDPTAPWQRLSLSSRIGLADVTATLPDISPLGSATPEDVARAFDAFGDGPSEACPAR
jgi:branched-chain amino acid transport system substrate-binding protein